jgi:hypothetical protein
MMDVAVMVSGKTNYQLLHTVLIVISIYALNVGSLRMNSNLVKLSLMYQRKYGGRISKKHNSFAQSARHLGSYGFRSQGIHPQRVITATINGATTVNKDFKSDITVKSLEYLDVLD